MECPRCKSAAVILELAGVEIDYCPDCGGIWLDAGELEDPAVRQAGLDIALLMK